MKKSQQPIFNPKELIDLGLNLSYVFNLNQLPQQITQQLNQICPNLKKYNQLILIGHAGNSFWQVLNQQNKNFESKNPIDDFCLNHTKQYFKQYFSNDEFSILFPQANGAQLSLGLQTLGELAGWHNDSPFKVGINPQWGSWFAYRAVVLAKSGYQPSKAKKSAPPCVSCESKPCITACPAQAITEKEYDFKACISYRQSDNSLCKDRCVARMSCPIATEHQYKIEQIKYHYGRSLDTIKSYLNIN